MALYLCVDFSTSKHLLALRNESAVIEERVLGPDEQIAEHCAAILARHGYSWRHLTTLLCGSGPGSFTGLRVALSFCKGISFACSIPLSLTPGLEALAVAGSAQGQLCVALSSAGREQCFSAWAINGTVLAPARLHAYAELPQIMELQGRGMPLVVQMDKPGHALPPQWQLCEVPPVNWSRPFCEMALPGAHSVQEIAKCEPTYGRAVSAKTIAERQK